MTTVLYILHEDDRYGAPRALLELIQDLKETKCVHPIVLTHKKDDNYRFCCENGIEVYSTGHINIVCGEKADLKSWLKWILKTVLNRVFDVVALIKLRKVDLQRVDIIHSNVSILSLGVLLKRRLHVPLIIHLREPAFIVDQYLFSRWHLIDFLNKSANCFVAISQFSSEQWSKKGILRKKIKVIYDGDLLADNSSSFNKNDETVVNIIVVGSLCAQKNQLFILKAVSRMSSIDKRRLCVKFVGDGTEEYREKLRDAAIDLEIDDIVSFEGYTDNVEKYYNKSDVGIIASIDESFGRVTVEYLAKGLIVLASNSGANPEIIEDGKSGYIFELDNPDSLAKLLSTVVNQITDLESMRKNAIERAKLFSVRESANNMMNLYNLIK